MAKKKKAPEPSKKAEQKRKQQVIEDRTFGELKRAEIKSIAVFIIADTLSLVPIRA